MRGIALAALAAFVNASPPDRQTSPPYLDASLSPAERAADLLGRMTWQEKVGQMGGIRRAFGSANGQPTFNRTSFERIRATQNGQIGYGPQLNWAADVLPLMNQLRAEQVNSSRLHIPYIVVADSVNSVWISGGTIFPGTLSLASSWNLPLYEEVVEAIRDENVAIGVNWVLSPEVDLAQDPRNGRNGEMYGEDAYLAGEFATAYILKMQEKDEHGWVKVATTIKHFVYGAGSGGVNRASIAAGINRILNDFGPPYRVAIRDAQPLSLMASYSTVDGVPMSINKHLLQDVLRGILGFKGLIMSDANAIQYLVDESRVASSRLDAAVKAVSAGLAHELHPGGAGLFADLAALDPAANPAVAALVDESVRSFLQIKFATGMFDRPLPTAVAMKKTLRKKSHLDVNRRISREAIVLLKNDGLLPLPERAVSATGKIAVLGPYADIINAGNYAPNDPFDRRYGDTFRTSFEKRLGKKNVLYAMGTSTVLPSYAADAAEKDAAAIVEAVRAAKAAGLAVVVLGSGLGNFDARFVTDDRTDGEGYAHADLGFPGRQRQLLDAVLDAGVPTVLVLSGGQAFVLDDATLARCRAVLHTWLGGEYTGDALVELALGDANPSGKLAVSLPQHDGAFPVAYDYLPSDAVGGFGAAAKYDWHWPQLKRKVPLAFGFGLSYTTFAMSGAEAKVVATPVGGGAAAAGGAAATPSVAVSVTVKNTGRRAGKEVVQLYFRPAHPTAVEFPVMRLVRFAKVELAAGESRRVALRPVALDELGYFVGGNWTVDGGRGGRYAFWVGSSSRAEDLTLLNVTIPEH